jgi:hypothetical protein
MKKLKTIGAILFSLYYSSLNAQYKKKDSQVIATINIKEAIIDGSDYTSEALKDKADLVFYLPKEGKEIMLSNYWKKSNTQSFGRIYSIVKEDLLCTEFKTERYHFQWDYTNTYDTIKGVASVKLLVIHKPEGNYFDFTIFTEALEVLLYYGFSQEDLAELSKSKV